MLWNKVLNNWENGIPLKYPKRVKGKFQWNTSGILRLASQDSGKLASDKSPAISRIEK